MAGTWLPEGTRERLSVQRGVTVAKSQTHALYTIRVLADEIRTGGHRWELPGRDQTCALSSVPAGELINFTAAFFSSP